MAEVEQKQRILIVDDESAIHQILCFFFKIHDFEALGVSSGKEAIQAITEFNPHLIILDLVMRPISGWDVLDWLHAHRLTDQIPVLVVSALVNLTDQLRGFERGAIEYITKPTQPSVIVERVDALLSMSIEQRIARRRKRMEEQRRILEHLHAAQPDHFTY